nr:MAG TPA: hypothetical protein [Microviridae sp.]
MISVLSCSSKGIFLSSLIKTRHYLMSESLFHYLWKKRCNLHFPNEKNTLYFLLPDTMHIFS